MELKWTFLYFSSFISQTGKKLVFRSEPPQLEKKEDEGADLATKEEEELQYYFAW